MRQHTSAAPIRHSKAASRRRVARSKPCRRSRATPCAGNACQTIGGDPPPPARRAGADRRAIDCQKLNTIFGASVLTSAGRHTSKALIIEYPNHSGAPSHAQSRCSSPQRSSLAALISMQFSKADQGSASEFLRWTSHALNAAPAR
jgi:hypothetical protein